MQVTTEGSPRPRPQEDSVERALDQVGDRWTFLILRDAFFGVRRFDGFQESTGASPNILSGRLRKLVEFGILEKRAYQERPRRFEYRQTEKGRDLYPAVVLIMQWGDRWAGQGAKPPLQLIHNSCGKVSRPELVCDQCALPVDARTMDWKAAT